MKLNKIMQKMAVLGVLSLIPETAVFADNSLSIFNNLLKATLTPKRQQTSAVRVRNPANTRVSRSIVYAGYSLEFLPIKKLVQKNLITQAYQLQKNKLTQQDTPEFLASNEAGLLALDSGLHINSIKHFADAERYLKINANDTVIEDVASGFTGEALSFITGKGDLTAYNGEPFERILMLNYKSIAYLLNGERKAYNVTRRAIDWQNIEKKEFEKTIEAAKKEIDKKENEIRKKAPGVLDSAAGTAKTVAKSGAVRNGVDATNIFNGASLFKIISDQYKSSKKEALSVPSAYVNPFGFYMAGIVQEFDSLEDASLRHNARISYQKALELNPKSKVIKRALRDIKRRPPRNRRLVHVIVADGFVPEKKVLQFAMTMPTGMVPVKLPVYEPVASKVAYIRIKSGKKTLATLSTVANIEAIVLRHQLDKLPLEHLKVIAAVARSSAENLLWSQMGVFGVIGKSLRESFSAPDTRGWMTLPKQILAARFYTSKYLKTITLVTYDKRWRQLSSKTIELPKKTHSFVYARTLDNNINAYTNKTLWVKKL
jgi:hypothetical protein